MLRYKSLSSDDNLLFFYSGHGFYLDALGYLVPVDGEDEANFILNSTIRDFLKPIKAKHIALIFDSCFSGSFVLNKDASVGSRLSEKASRWALAAGNIELVSDGIAGRNAPFTGALLDVLKNSTETELGIQELFVEARNLTISRGAKQTPIGGQMAMDGNDGGEFVFYRTNNEANAWNALDISDKNALNAFILKYPNSPFLNEVTIFITKIEAKEAKKRQIDDANRKIEAEKQAYERAKTNPTAYNLNQFLKNYPLSIYAENIEKRLAEAEEEAPSVPAPSETVLTDNETSDFQKAATIPAINAYLQRYPNGKNRAAATDKLNKLTAALNTHLNNVRSQIKDFPEAAKEDLDKAQAIDPTNADVIKLTNQLR